MRSRAVVAESAMLSALSDLNAATTSGSQMAQAASDAASAAYDSFADREMRQRDWSTAEGGAASSQPVVSDGAGADQQRVPVSEAVLQQRPYFQVQFSRGALCFEQI